MAEQFQAYQAIFYIVLKNIILWYRKFFRIISFFGKYWTTGSHIATNFLYCSQTTGDVDFYCIHNAMILYLIVPWLQRGGDSFPHCDERPLMNTQQQSGVLQGLAQPISDFRIIAVIFHSWCKLLSLWSGGKLEETLIATLYSMVILPILYSYKKLLR